MLRRFTFRSYLSAIEFAFSGYLWNRGWPKSRAHGRALDAFDRPIPWFTYSAIDFLETRRIGGLSICEFGGGNGTAWWADHGCRLSVVEHDDSWLEQTSRIPNVHCIKGTEPIDCYVNAADAFGPFDIVVVDGLYRPECLLHAPNILKQDGIIILDDAKRREYRAAREELSRIGWRTVIFTGMQPISKHEGATEIFYREGNVLWI